ncbi:MAG: hypothetical protein ACTSQE_17040 [Candidatus Heimdallarchaeaceae archaeon]
MEMEKFEAENTKEYSAFHEEYHHMIHEMYEQLEERKSQLNKERKTIKKNERSCNHSQIDAINHLRRGVDALARLAPVWVTREY